MGQRQQNTVQQFVNSEDAGRGGGLSPWEFGSNSFTGGPGNTPPVVVPVPQPRAGGGGGSGDGGQ